MRKQVIKKINKKAESLLMIWLKGLLSKEEQEKVNTSNFKSLLPHQEYIESNRTFYTSFFTLRWAKQSIKKLLKKGYVLEDITLDDLKSIITVNKKRSAIL